MDSVARGERWEAALEALGEIATAAAFAPHSHQLAKVAVRLVSELLDGPSVTLYWSDPGEAGLVALADSDPEGRNLGRHPPAGSSVALAFEQQRAVVVEDYAAWPGAVPEIVARGVASVMSVPLIWGGHSVGALAVRSRRRLQFEPEVVRLVTSFANQTAAVLHTARLYSESEQRRRQAEAFIDLSLVAAGKERLTGTVEAAAEQACQLLGADFSFVALMDPRDRLVVLGERGLNNPVPVGVSLHGNGPIQHVTAENKTLVAQFKKGDAEFSGVKLPVLGGEGARTAVYVPLVAPGKLRGALVIAWRRHVEPSAEQLRMAETFGSYAGTLIAAKQVEDALQDSEARYRAIVETAQEGICTVDAHGRLLYVNARLCDMLGARQQDLIGHFETELLKDGGTLGSSGSIMSLLPAGSSQADFALACRDGSERWVSVSTGPISDADADAGAISLFTDITHRKAAEERLRTRAFYDSLTGLPNRSLLEDRVQQAILASRRSLGALGLLFIDLDRFKAVNDTFGHQAGDQVLREVGKRIQQAVRESDTVARLGGDEFVIFLTSISGAEDAAAAADRIHELLDAPFHVRGHRVALGASVGLAVYPTHGDTLDELLRSADRAMYEAKRGSRSA